MRGTSYMFYSIMVILLFSFSCSRNGDTVRPGQGIRIYSENPRYWEYKGRPVLLLGGSAEDNLFQYPNDYYGEDAPGLEAHLDLLVSVGGNYIRNTMSSRNPGNLFPYAKIYGTPGVNTNTDVYDLNQWDDEYWRRFDDLLKLSAQRDIIVQLELFDRFDLHQAESEMDNADARGNRNTGWESHPWNPDRNVNYSENTSGLRGGKIDSMDDENELYYAVPSFAAAKRTEPVVLETLQKYVDKILSYTFSYDNILYVIENESYQPMEFGDYWIDYIQKKADEAGKTIYITNMRGNPDPGSPTQQTILEGRKYTFFDYSQNNHNYGREHYQNNIDVRESIQGNPKPINNVKLYGGLQYPDGIEEGKRRFWRAIFSGIAAVRFHREGVTETAFGIGLNSDAQIWIRSARSFTDRMDIFKAEPAAELLSNMTNEAYCMAEEGRQYAIYFANGGSATIDMSRASGAFEMQWLDIARSQWVSSEIITGGESKEITAPASGQWAVLITKQ
jgi:hypothetical protein